MSKADEMFEKLGYEKFYENSDTIRYSNGNSIIIEFRNGLKAFDKSNYGITMQELQAINAKVKELRMGGTIMRECKCCHEIEFWKDANLETDKKAGCSHKIFACITSYGWRKGERRIKGKQHSVITSKAYDLNYCPTCGRKLEVQ